MSIVAGTLALASMASRDVTAVQTEAGLMLVGRGTAKAISVAKGARPVAWSFDGRWLVTAAPSGDGRFSVEAVAPIGEEPRALSLGEEASLPSLSPDGRRVAFGRKGRGLAIVDLGEGEPKARPALPTGDHPSWSPDGHRLAFAGVGDRGGVWVVEPGASTVQPRPLVRDLAATAMAWSPDGRTIAVVGRGKATRNEMQVLLAWPGRRETKLLGETDGPGLAWSPNGAWLLVRRRGEWGRMDASDGAWSSLGIRGEACPQWLGSREVLAAREGRAETAILRGGAAEWSVAPEQSALPEGSGRVLALCRLRGIVVESGPPSPFGGAPRPGPGFVRAQGSIVALDLSAESLTLDVSALLGGDGDELNLAKPVRTEVVWRADTRRLREGGGRPLRPTDLTLDAEVAVYARGTARPGDRLEADSVWIAVPSALARVEESVQRPPRTLEHDGVSMDRVVVPLVFPMLGKSSWSDTFLAPRAGGRRRHHGQDIMAPKMRPMVAAFDGVVTFGGSSSHYTLYLRSDDGWVAAYMHINNDTPGTDDGAGGHRYAFAPGLRSGDRVVAGQLLAFNGDSGNAESTAPHLHFELRDAVGGGVLNPAPSLREATTIAEPAYPLPAPELRPAGGEARWDGVVVNFDDGRGVLTLESIAEVDGKGRARVTTTPRLVYVRLADATELTLRPIPGQTVTCEHLRPGVYVSAVGPTPKPGEAMVARRLAVSISMAD